MFLTHVLRSEVYLTTLISQCPPPCWMPRLRGGYDACMKRAPRGKDLTIVGDARNMGPHRNIEMGWWQYHAGETGLNCVLAGPGSKPRLTNGQVTIFSGYVKWESWISEWPAPLYLNILILSSFNILASFMSYALSFCQCWGSNPGPCTCRTSYQPLNHIPVLAYVFLCFLEGVGDQNDGWCICPDPQDWTLGRHKARFLV